MINYNYIFILTYLTKILIIIMITKRKTKKILITEKKIKKLKIIKVIIKNIRI